MADKIDPNFLLELRDRGNIKWTAMMLTEHREALFAMERAQLDVDPPDHDLDRLTEIADILARAKLDGNPVQLCYWKDKRNHEVFCTIKRIDPYKKAVLIEIDEDDRRWIPAQMIVRLEMN